MIDRASTAHFPISTPPPKSSYCYLYLRQAKQITMSLPPEQINIKRRREEEPVETLCKLSFLFCRAAYHKPLSTIRDDEFRLFKTDRTSRHTIRASPDKAPLYRLCFPKSPGRWQWHQQVIRLFSVSNPNRSKDSPHPEVDEQLEFHFN